MISVSFFELSFVALFCIVGYYFWLEGGLLDIACEKIYL